MSWQAKELGISLKKLERERFTHANHLKMLKEHYQRVRLYEIERYLVALQDRPVSSPKKVKPKPIKARKPKYSFTEEQLRIATKSLERHAEAN
jgi:hypothetical protein